jgi:hypothetical protein
MTTVIATKEGIYTDTKCSYKINFKVHKFAKIGTSIFAGAGDLEGVSLFFDWRRNGGDMPTLDDDVDILEVCSDGIFLWGKKCIRLHVNEDFYAVGSGSHYAMGAMAMGATPRKAIEIASRLDSDTGLPIESIKLRGK